MAEYNFKTGVDAGEYRDFLNVSPAYCFTQLPEWSEVKDNWDHDICTVSYTHLTLPTSDLV